MKLDHIVILLSDLGANLPFYETLLPMIGLRTECASRLQLTGVNPGFAYTGSINLEYPVDFQKLAA